MKRRITLSDISIRVAVQGDVSDISRLLRSLSHSYLVSTEDSEVGPFFATLTEEATAAFVGRPDVMYLVARAATTELAGVAALGGNQRVEHLFVDPAYQGIGLGRRLWEHLRDHALRSGNPGVFKVNASLGAVPIYERFGFVIAAPTIERYGGAYVPMILKPAG